MEFPFSFEIEKNYLFVCKGFILTKIFYFAHTIYMKLTRKSPKYLETHNEILKRNTFSDNSHLLGFLL